MSDARGPGRQVQFAVFWLALALILIQVSLTRLLAYKLYYHFVYLAVSLALLGLGGAGTFVSVRARPASLVRRIGLWLAILALSIPIVFELLNFPFLLLPPDQGFIKVLGRPALLYLVCISPLIVWLNFCGGVVLASVFSEYGKWMGKIYSRDLAGTGLGAILCIVLMKYVTPPVAFLSATLFVLLAWMPLHRMGSADDPKQRARAVAASAGLVLACVFAFGPRILRSFDGWSGASDRFIKYEWDHMFRTDHRTDVGYSLDAGASTELAKWDETSRQLPVVDPVYVVAPARPEVAIIGSGGGLQVAEARRAGAAHVVAVDINATIVRWMLGTDRELTGGVLDDPSIEVIAAEARHTLRSLKRRFDVIVMHAIDTYSATASGAYALSENFLYTKEAFKDYYASLDRGGVMSVSRWLFQPPRENLRLFATALESLEELGVESPTHHVVMIAPLPDYEKMEQERVWGYMLFAKEPFSPEQIDGLVAHVEAMDWDMLYAPEIESQSLFSEYARTPDRRAFQASYPYFVAPVTDTQPYLFQLHRLFGRTTYTIKKGMNSLNADQSSAAVLLVSLLVTVVLSVVIILLPLWLRPAAGGSSGPAGTQGLSVRQVIYFSGLGVGFMAFEIPLVQIMSLYLGHPTYGFSVVLVALLLFASVGSLLVERVRIHQGVASLVVAVVVAAVMLSIFQLLHLTIDWPDAARFALSLILVSLCAVPMGFPLPLAIRTLSGVGPRAIAWGWAVNGTTSVIGSCLVMAVMVYSGSTTAVAISAVCYVIAALAGMGWRVGRETEPAAAGSAEAARA